MHARGFLRNWIIGFLCIRLDLFLRLEWKLWQNLILLTRFLSHIFKYRVCFRNLFWIRDNSSGGVRTKSLKSVSQSNGNFYDFWSRKFPISFQCFSNFSFSVWKREKFWTPSRNPWRRFILYRCMEAPFSRIPFRTVNLRTGLRIVLQGKPGTRIYCLLYLGCWGWASER